MEFLRQILAEADDGPTKDNLDDALQASEETAMKMWMVAIDAAKPFIEKGDFRAASIVIIAAVWQCLDVAKDASTKTAAMHGEDNGVSLVWDMFEATFMSKDAAEAKRKLDALAKRMKK